jgi:hypothetical protein
MTKNTSRQRRTTVSINRLIVGLVDQRNLILEGSAYYKANMAQLTERLAARTITPELAKNIQPSIQMSALRLAGVPFRKSLAMVKA